MKALLRISIFTLLAAGLSTIIAMAIETPVNSGGAGGGAVDNGDGVAIHGGNIDADDPDILSLGKFVRADLIPNKIKDMIHAHHRTIPKLMTVPPAFFRKAVIEEFPYPVKAAYMQCCNPLMSYADSQKTLEALLKLDFFAVSDIVISKHKTRKNQRLKANWYHSDRAVDGKSPARRGVCRLWLVVS